MKNNREYPCSCKKDYQCYPCKIKEDIEEQVKIMASIKGDPSTYKISLKNQWIKIQDQLPEIDSIVLVFTKFNSCSVAIYDHEKNYWLNSETGSKILKIVTHWMPLPEKPQDTA